MRDKNKNEKYFQDKILRIKEELKQINADEKSLLKQGSAYDVCAFNIEKSSLLSMQVWAEYSKGNSIESIVGSFINMLEDYTKSWYLENDYSDGGDIVYSELISIISLGTLLDTKQELLQLYNLMKKVNYKDYIADFLFKYLKPDIVPYPELLWHGDEACENLKAITLQQDKSTAETSMKQFLENNFYTKENLENKYNSHKKNDNVYEGYWSFESGAIVKIMGLDDSSFKDSLYYPYDMVHWKDEIN